MGVIETLRNSGLRSFLSQYSVSQKKWGKRYVLEDSDLSRIKQSELKKFDCQGLGHRNLVGFKLGRLEYYI